MLSMLNKPAVERDRIVILNEDGTADIATIYDVDDTAMYASSGTQDYAVPIADTKATSYVGGSGRIYFLAADPDYVRDTVRLAALEKSIVLRQVTQFERRPDEKKGLNIKEILLYVLVGILLLAVVFK